MTRATQSGSSSSWDSAASQKLAFLRAWKCHSIFRNSLCRSKPAELQALAALFPDIKLQAALDLYTDPFYASQGVTNGQPTTTFPTINGNNNNNIGSATKLNDFSFVGHAAVARPRQTFIPTPLQNLVDAELESIQEAILKAALDNNNAVITGENNAAIASTVAKASGLPMSIMRSVLGGDNASYALPLHSILAGLDEEGEANNAVTNSYFKIDKDDLGGPGDLKSEFISSVKAAIGELDGNGEIFILLFADGNKYRRVT